MDLKADRQNLNQLFGAKGIQFQVPPYQRPYAWEAEQIDDLWEDLVSTLGEGHFLGTIVLNNEDEDRPQIIDGQQRLTTVMVLLALLRDEYDRLDSKFAGRVQDLLIADAYADGDARYRLRVGEKNWRAFRDFVYREKDDEARVRVDETVKHDPGGWNRRLFENARRLADRLAEWLPETKSEREARLEELETALVKRLQVVAIRVGNVGDAFLLFETLNDRGLQLSAADLLKNHLLAQVGKKGDEASVREAAAEWDGLVDDLGSDVDVTRFLRHFLLIRYPKVRKDDIFDRFKSQASESGPRAMLHDLRQYGRLYGEFEDPSRVQDEEVRQALEDLKTLRAVTCYTALMPARRFLSSEDFTRFARLAEVLTYRYSTIASRDAKDLERIYHRAAKLLAESEGANLEEARQELIAAMPDSEIFVRSFMDQRMGRQYVVRYTLGRIEERLSDENEKEFRANKKVHIEHIMPQTLSDAWVDALGDRVIDHAAAVDLWGNLTLLYYKMNIRARNDSFATKQEYYAKSAVTLTRQLCEEPEWTIDSIHARQRWLAELADRIWSIPSETATDSRLPDWPARDQLLAQTLPARELTLLRDMSVETAADEMAPLVDRVRDHTADLLADLSDAAVRAECEALGRALISAIGESAQLDAHARRLLRGAVDYFLLAEDAAPDTSPGGLEDDRRVVDAVLTAIADRRLS